jgi:hypothetical protein
VPLAQKTIGKRVLFGERAKLAWLGFLSPMPCNISRVYHDIEGRVIVNLNGVLKKFLSDRPLLGDLFMSCR